MVSWQNYCLIKPHTRCTLLGGYIETNAKGFVSKHDYKLYLMGDSVEYLKLNPFDRNLEFVSLKYAAMKKDKCYEHENEYRFLISALPSWAYPDIRDFRFKLESEKLSFNVICHPLMENWKIENISIPPLYRVLRVIYKGYSFAGKSQL